MTQTRPYASPSAIFAKRHSGDGLTFVPASARGLDFSEPGVLRRQVRNGLLSPSFGSTAAGFSTRRTPVMAARARWCSCDAESRRFKKTDAGFGIGSSAIKGAIKSQRSSLMSESVSLAFSSKALSSGLTRRDKSNSREENALKQKIKYFHRFRDSSVANSRG